MAYYLSMENKTSLKEARTKFNLSQMQAASVLNIPIRTFIRYEVNEEYGDKLKREVMIRNLNDKFEITNDKGIISLKEIKEVIPKVIEEKYKGQINFCYLFGSYAKGYATGKSDVDFLVSTSLTGLHFVGIAEEFRAVLCDKKIDLVKFEHQKDNLELLFEIMKDGIRIY